MTSSGRAVNPRRRRPTPNASLDGVAIDRSVKATLERLMPIYRKHWWKAHDRKNREWIAAARTLVDRHGAALNAARARAYSVVPDNPVWVQIPDSTGAWTVTFGADKILLLPGSRQRLSGRPVVGASVVVTRLANVRSELQASGLNPVVDTTSTILLPPELTCGIWLEFREGR